MGWYSRLWLCGVITQGNGFSLDLVETLLAEVVPVSKKPKFWWTTPFPKAQSTIDSAWAGSRQLVQGMGQSRGATIGASRKWKRRTAGSRHRNSQSWLWGVKVRGMDFEGAWLVKAKVNQWWRHNHWKGRQTRHMDKVEDETNIQNNTKQRVEAKHWLEIWTWVDEQQQTQSQLAAQEQNQEKLNFEQGNWSGCITGHNADNEQMNNEQGATDSCSAVHSFVHFILTSVLSHFCSASFCLLFHTKQKIRGFTDLT